MILALVVALLQTAPASSGDARPVRVWLGSSGGLVRGASVRVYVQTTRDGNLIVLHRRTDGRIDVLFPGKPSEDVFVRAGTYEIQATSDHVAFVVAEPDGSGLVLAALAPRAYRFDEFVRAAEWNPEALAPAWNGSDGEGVLSDIVQRMLGDGYFNYDIASYSVAPPMYAAQQDTGVPPPTRCTRRARIARSSDIRRTTTGTGLISRVIRTTGTASRTCGIPAGRSRMTGSLPNRPARSRSQCGRHPARR